MANSPKYSGTVIKLITNAGSTSGGTISYGYSTSSTTKPSTWVGDITNLTVSKAGTYYVYYKVTGDTNYKDVAETRVGSVSVTAQQYTVTLDANDGSIRNGYGVTSYTYGTATTLPGSQYVTKSGFLFDGWYTKDGTNGQWGDKVTQISATDTGNKTYYAKWIEHTHNYRLHSYGYFGGLLNGVAYYECSECPAKTTGSIGYLTTSYLKKFKVSKGKNKFTVKWKKQSKKNQKKFSGYQVQVSAGWANPNSTAIYNVKKTKSSKTFKKMGRKKVYYVRVRTYTGANPSKWSGWKKVKTK